MEVICVSFQFSTLSDVAFAHVIIRLPLQGELYYFQHYTLSDVTLAYAIIANNSRSDVLLSTLNFPLLRFNFFDICTCYSGCIVVYFQLPTLANYCKCY